MRKYSAQMSLFDIYNDVCSAMEEDKPKLIQMLEEHIDFKKFIPAELHSAFYRVLGRPRKYSLESFMRFFILQKILGISSDGLLLNILKLSAELRDFCGFRKVPDASKTTRFRQEFAGYLKIMFDRLVEITEPICREIDAKKADYLIYDPTGIEANVSENNPKFLNTKLNQTKKRPRKTLESIPTLWRILFCPRLPKQILSSSSST